MRKWRPWVSMWVWLVGTAGESTGSDVPDAAASYDASIPSDATTDDSGSHEITCGGCLCVDPTWSCPDTTRVNERREAVELADEAGYLEFERETTGHRARMWYWFHPADEAPEDKPVVLLFNGGPYAPTLLSTLGTGPQNFYEAEVVANPASFTRFANVLYVDPAGMGFSYDVDQSAALSMAEDADLFVRTLLAFLKRHPSLRDNQVGLIGESYGSVRTTYMLDRIFGRELTGPATPALRSLLREHFLGVFGNEAPGHAQIAEQFAFQVFIQGIVGVWTSGECEQMGADGYDCADTTQATERQLDFVFDSFRDPERWFSMLRLDPRTIAWLGWDGENLPLWNANGSSSEFRDVAGTLAWQHMASTAFIENAKLVRALLTVAEDDGVVRTEDFPIWIEQAEVEGIASVVHDTAPRSGIERPGWMKITFEGDASLTEIRTPPYQAGHMVTLRAGPEFAEDVEALLRGAP